MTRTLLHPCFTGLEEIDWDDTGSILEGCTPVFDALTTDPALLSALLDILPGQERLTGMCEQYDFLSKLVLHTGGHDGQIRVRLHLYRPGYFDRPHNHRWPFAARIVCGSYRHRLFGQDQNFGEHTNPRQLQPICERIETPGSTYALQHTGVHTVQAEADTISLLIRGPAAKDRFLILDAAAERFFWVYGAAQETATQRASKQMNAIQLAETITRVRQLTGLNSSKPEDQ